MLAGMIEMTEGDECIPNWKKSEKTELQVPVILCASLIATWMYLQEIILSMPEGLAEAEDGGQKKALAPHQISIEIGAVYVQAL